jgi:hypothetical protein
MQENDTNIIAVTDKVKAFIGKLAFSVRKLEGSLEIFSRLKYFVEEISVETYKWITDPFHVIRTKITTFVS